MMFRGTRACCAAFAAALLALLLSPLLLTLFAWLQDHSCHFALWFRVWLIPDIIKGIQ
jgi:hypothetical protein